MSRWKKADVEKLRKLVAESQPWETIARELERTVDSVKMLAKRLGLSVVVSTFGKATTTNDLPEELPSVEEILKVLAWVLKALDTPGVEISEIQRLQAMVATIRTYKEMLADYLRYREIEKKLVEIEVKYAELVTKQEA